MASLQQDPEFIALLDELEPDILRQRQWYEENKDKPCVLTRAIPRFTPVLLLAMNVGF